MNGFHVNWSKPYFVRSDGFPRDVSNYEIKDYDILMTILSALKWREKNGGIKLYTDKICAEYYCKLGLENLWDRGIDTCLDEIPEYIDADQFWASGKIFALKKEKAPSTMIDLDLIIWNDMDHYFENDVAVIHKEPIDMDIYPSYKKNPLMYDFVEKNNYDWTVLPCNTAFLYIKDNNFKDYYCDKSIEFMLKNSNMPNTLKNRLVYMVFAEQRLLSMCADKKSLNILPIISSNTNILNSYNFTHLWGFKYSMEMSYYTRVEFCLNIMRRIIHDFPEYEDILMNIPQLSRYTPSLILTPKK